MRFLQPPLVSDTIETHIKAQGREVKTFTDIAASLGYEVATFSALRNEIARLSIVNPGSILFYRGQKEDYQRNEVSTIMPSIYREGSELAPPNTMTLRWQNLKIASRILVEELNRRKMPDCNAVKSRKLIQWSILQHYEAALTPLTDVTQSLRVACSFATLENTSGTAFIYVFALPYYHNRVSRNSEEEVTNIRLLSICPPDAKRPYLQEGFLVGEEDIEFGGMALEGYDLRRRMIAKFQIPNNKEFWDEEIALSQNQLYPNDDKYEEICKIVGKRTAEELPPLELNFTDEQVFNFIAYWRKIEQLLNETYGAKGKNIEDLIMSVPIPNIQLKLKKTEMALQLLVHPNKNPPNRLKSYVLNIGELYKSLVRFVIERDR